MNNKLIPARKVKRYKHFLYGIIILISGIMIGATGGVYMFGKHMEFFRNPPRRVVEKITNDIIEDYPELSSHEKEVKDIIEDSHYRFKNLNDEISYRILQLQHGVAEEISNYIPKKRERNKWMHDFPEYFPGHQHRMKRARRFEEKQECEPDNCMFKDWDRLPPPPRKD